MVLAGAGSYGFCQARWRGLLIYICLAGDFRVSLDSGAPLARTARFCLADDIFSHPGTQARDSRSCLARVILPLQPNYKPVADINTRAARRLRPCRRTKMKKHVFAGVAAFALISGTAMAQQGVLTDTTTVTRQSTVPVPEGFTSQKTEKVINSNGVETSKTQTYSSGVTGSTATSATQTVAPDGTVTKSTQEERTSTPLGETTSMSKTTTTIER